MLLVAVAFPVPNVFLDAPAWLTFGVVPAYIAFALVTGTFWITRRTVRRLRWSIEQKPPNRTDQRNIAAAPWRVARSEERRVGKEGRCGRAEAGRTENGEQRAAA